MQTREITIQSAARIPIPDLVQAFNASYVDYYVPIYLTPDSLERVVERESVQLSMSAVAREGRRVVGQGWLAARGSRGWIGGVGVLPHYRGQGIGRLLMEHLIAQGHRAGLATLQLEVITQNERAHALYESLGFQTIRRLLILMWSGDSNALSDGADTPVAFSAHDPAALLDAMRPLMSVPRPWQREPEGIQGISAHLNGLASWHGDGALAGGCIYRTEGDQAGILDMAAATVEIGRHLLIHTLRAAGVSQVSYTNVPDDDPLLPVLLDAGFIENLSQFEMVLRLKPERVQ
jgi:ribosomal protein S18 acetylase RimI-like enzyme